MSCLLDNDLDLWPLAPKVFLVSKDTVHAAPLISGDEWYLTLSFGDIFCCNFAIFPHRIRQCN